MVPAEVFLQIPCPYSSLVPVRSCLKSKQEIVYSLVFIGLAQNTLAFRFSN